MLKIFVVIFLFFLVQSQSMASGLKAGLASNDLTPGNDVPLGGYGSGMRRGLPFIWFKYPYVRFFRNAKGRADAIRAKAMVLEKNNRKLLFLSLDVVGVTAEFYTDLVGRLRPLGLTRENIFISATHTHSGPGALSRNYFWQIWAMDRFNPTFYEWFMEGIVDTVREAQHSLTEVHLYHNSFITTGLQRNRRGSDRPLDPEAHTLFAQSPGGQWLGGIVNFAVHGVSLHEDNLLFSADTPGSIEREIQNYLMAQTGGDPTVLFINSAEGDVSPMHHGIDGMKRMGEEFVSQLGEHWQDQSPLNEQDINVRSVSINLGKPKANLRNCIDKKWVPRWANAGMGRFFARTTRISQVTLGPLLMMTWPGEPTTELGLMLKQRAREFGISSPWILGLTNDHLAYFTTPGEFSKGGMEACANLYGPDGGMKIIKGHAGLFSNTTSEVLDGPR